VSWWDHFVADAVPTAVMGFIAVAALVATIVTAYLKGVATADVTRIGRSRTCVSGSSSRSS
jgi:hypothetical protein